MTQVFDSPREAARHISPAVLAILREYPLVSEGHQRYLATCLKWIIREMPVYPTKASRRAIERARELGFPSLLALRWVDQLKFDRGRKSLHWEHVVPVGDIRRRLLELTNPSLDEVRAILETYMVAWITKDEDKRLPKTRRANPLACYEQAGIELVDLRDM